MRALGALTSASASDRLIAHCAGTKIQLLKITTNARKQANVGAAWFLNDSFPPYLFFKTSITPFHRAAIEGGVFLWFARTANAKASTDSNNRSVG